MGADYPGLTVHNSPCWQSVQNHIFVVAFAGQYSFWRKFVKYSYVSRKVLTPTHSDIFIIDHAACILWHPMSSGRALEVQHLECLSFLHIFALNLGFLFSLFLTHKYQVSLSTALLMYPPPTWVCIHTLAHKPWCVCGVYTIISQSRWGQHGQGSKPRSFYRFRVSSEDILLHHPYTCTQIWLLFSGKWRFFTTQGRSSSKIRRKNSANGKHNKGFGSKVKNTDKCIFDVCKQKLQPLPLGHWLIGPFGKSTALRT